MVEVHHVAFEFFLIDVDDGEVVYCALVDQCVCVGHSHVACSDENDLVSDDVLHNDLSKIRDRLVSL